MDISSGTVETSDALTAVLTVAMNLENAIRRPNSGLPFPSSMSMDSCGKDKEMVVEELEEENSLPAN